MEWQFQKIAVMDQLINYPGFDKDVIESFCNLISDFGLEFEEISEGRFLLKGEKCIIRITNDRGDIFCGFLRPEELNSAKPSYSIWAVFRYLNPSTKNDDSERNFDPKDQLLEAANLVGEELRNVLLGDFNWLPGFLAKELYERELSNFVLNELEYESSISKKFWEGDPSWKIDVEEYIRQNNIKI